MTSYAYDTTSTTSSGYEISDGTDLDDIFFIKDSTANISEEYLIQDLSGSGRYLERTLSSYDTSKDTGYEIEGVDLNRLYIRRDDKTQVSILLTGSPGDVKEGRNSTNQLWAGNGGGSGAKFTITIECEPNLVFHTGYISGGQGGTEAADWTGDGGDGGRAHFLMVNNTGGTISWVPGMNDSRLLAVAGGGGGQGGYASHGNKSGNPGGDGGDAGIGWGGTGTYGNFKYKQGSAGGWIKYGGSSVVNSGTARGGAHPGSTAVRQRYGMTMHDNLGFQEYVGNSASQTPYGANGRTVSGTGYQYYYRGAGGAGGAGYGGGASGAPGVHGGRYFRSSGGGGGGSSAYRYQNLPPGIISMAVGTLTANAPNNTPPNWNHYRT